VLHIKPTINARPAIDLFINLMQDGSQEHLFFLEGEKKLGKTHLLSRVLSEIATQHYQARKVMIDCSRPLTTIENILNKVMRALGEEAFPNYLTTRSKRLTYPNSTTAIEKSVFILSRTDVTGTTHSTDTGIGQSWDSELTQQFILDFRRFCSSNSRTVFFVDNADCAEPLMQAWLMNTFFVYLMEIAQVRIVVSTRQEIQPDLQYEPLCKRYKLSEVQDVEEYKIFCKSVYPHLQEQTIKVIAYDRKYNPGLFVNHVEELQWANVL
jgi:hypothetical protein